MDWVYLQWATFCYLLASIHYCWKIRNFSFSCLWNVWLGRFTRLHWLHWFNWFHGYNWFSIIKTILFLWFNRLWLLFIVLFQVSETSFKSRHSPNIFCPLICDLQSLKYMKYFLCFWSFIWLIREHFLEDRSNWKTLDISQHSFIKLLHSHPILLLIYIYLLMFLQLLQFFPILMF